MDVGTAGAVVQAQHIAGGIHLHSPSSGLPAVPKQLPAAPAFFTGREAELAALDRMSASAGMIVLSGPAGVGKTALALTWLHGVRTRYPDGQLFGDLQAYAGDGGVSADHMLGMFLRALGVPARVQPVDIVELAALFRSLTTDRRLLIMLDNVAAANEVVPLLPGPPDALVILTTRQRLPGLVARGAHALDLGLLPEESARELVLDVLGGHGISATPADVEPLVHACGGLPLALRLALAQLACRRWSGAGEVARLLAHGRSLDVFQADELSVRTALNLSYQRLSPSAARAFRLVGEYPGADFACAVAARAIATDHEEAGKELQALVDLHLVEELDVDRYRMHDLIRQYAREKAAAADGVDTTDAATLRMGEWYLAAALIADRAVMPTRRRLDDFVGDVPGTPAFSGAETALDWAETHLPHHLAVVRRSAGHALCYRLVDALWGVFLYRKHYAEWLESHEIGLRAAREDQNFLAETLLLNHLGLGLHGLGRLAEARGLFLRALALHREHGDRVGEATALNSIGLVFLAEEQWDDACAYFEQALAAQVELGQRRGEALTRVNLARVDLNIGRTLSARTHLALARSAFESLADRYNTARADMALSTVHIHDGQFDQARWLLTHSLTVLSSLGADKELARAHDVLADLASRVGDHLAATRHRDTAAQHRWRVRSSSGDQARRHEARQPGGHLGFGNTDKVVDLPAQKCGEQPGP
ncbi:tetratricopeptide repeat protein [Kutzneria sp. 744]|uniref:tetratricopeptide repeat protein n=1 Tax=Kutzneria sp. (strain 744) TaxID=345341 RepID=UPI0018DCC771|nr:tetratricopeptide repeat protein [Kutzneria sp. 744]